MTRRLTILLTALAVLCAATAPAFAHDDYRIIGTLTKVSAREIEVKQTKDGKIIVMGIDKTAAITRDKKKLALSALKPSLSVVVDATGDSIDELDVVAIKIVPAPDKK